MDNKPQKKESFFTKIHRDGFTWKDSLFIHGIITAALLLAGTLLQSLPQGLSMLYSGENQDYIKTLGFYAPFLIIWIIVILFCLIVKTNRPILKSFWRGLKGNTLPKLLIGLIIGFAINATSICGALLHGDISITWQGVSASMIGLLLILIVAIFLQCGAEELLYRGYYFQRLRKGYKNPAFAIFINPIIFLLAHVFNPGATLLSLFNTYIVGVFMSLLVYYFDSFWMAMSFHFAWNFTQNTIFGLPNSGNVLPFSFGKMDLQATESSFFYNVDYGVESTLFTTALIIVAGLIVFFIGRRRKNPATDIWTESL